MFLKWKKEDDQELFFDFPQFPAQVNFKIIGLAIRH